MRRRDFITVLGGAAAASPLPVDAQQQPIPVIGFLSTVAPEGFSDRLRGFREGLREAGYIEGNNVAIEFRWAENRLERLPELGADLVRRQVSVIVASGGTAGALTAKSLNTTIPVVFGIPENPVELGLVASLSRPGGTMTGVNFFVGEVLAKRLDLLREVVPTAKRVAVFVNPANLRGLNCRCGNWKRRLRRWACRPAFLRPAPAKPSTRHLRRSPTSGPMRSSSALIRSSLPGGSSSPPWRHATRLRRPSRFVRSSMPVD